ncbi:N-6 DNA methylase [Thalassospira sp. MA62]|nr:N-6 DNA methylase [Thalassospira sp. MA62]
MEIRDFDAKLGFMGFSGDAVVRGGTREFVQKNHPYRPEIESVLSSKTPECPSASAIFCVESTPTVCLLDADELPEDFELRELQLRRLCEKLWNQNLVSSLLVLEENNVEAWSVADSRGKAKRLRLDDAKSRWSAESFRSGSVLQTDPNWFAPEQRIDFDLVKQIGDAVDELITSGVEGSAARTVIARIIFVSYLEHRGIVGDHYRLRRNVEKLHDLIRCRDYDGIDWLFECLRADFNGDFLKPSPPSLETWKNLPDAGLDTLSKFLDRTDIQTGQRSFEFWQYDFSEIPVELISGIYETFLVREVLPTQNPATGGLKSKRSTGTYYTPRVLASHVVEEAFSRSECPSKERVCDGACGSGILLTTAYRKLIREQEFVHGRTLNFEERKQLLTGNIFGGDVNEDACRLTAFSLYLALLSGLDPSDMAKLEEQGGKLPDLLGKNILYGQSSGDFFSEESQSNLNHKCSIFISNPPWFEATGDKKSFEHWLERLPVKTTVPRRQIAAAFALRAADTVVDDGAVVLIVPATLFTSSGRTDIEFRKALINRYDVEKVTNFADMRRIIFADAVHPFVVVRAKKHVKNYAAHLMHGKFEYACPKADLAIALKRLVVHATDTMWLPINTLLVSSPELASRYWATDRDIAFVKGLQLRGTIGDIEAEQKNGWLLGKGFHLKDGKKEVAPTQLMQDSSFLNARNISRDSLVVREEDLVRFPYQKIAQIREDRFFTGPRLLFPDGTHPGRGVKVVYSEKTFSYQSSVGAISAPEEDRSYLRLLAAFMKSKLGHYFSVILSHSVAEERPKIHLKELRSWPFWKVERHPKPMTARNVLKRVDEIFNGFEDELPIFNQGYQLVQKELDKLVMDYFCLDDGQRSLVEEMIDFIGPSIQPRSQDPSVLNTPLARQPDARLLDQYVTTLADEMRKWRDGAGGNGEIHGDLLVDRKNILGAAVLEIGDFNSSSDTSASQHSLLSILTDTLGRVAKGISPEVLFTVPNLTIIDGKKIYIVKPLRNRFWLQREALRDADRIASEIQAVSRARKTKA